MDSNHRPHAYQACALTTWAMRPFRLKLTGYSFFLYPLAFRLWWRWGGSNSWPPACKAGALPAELHPHFFQGLRIAILFPSLFKLLKVLLEPSKLNNALSLTNELWLTGVQRFIPTFIVSLERRWSSRTFRYGYLVTTSPQSSIPPSTAPSKWLGYRLRVLPTPMVWRAVCTRPGNVFTAACWSAITSNSDFM